MLEVNWGRVAALLSGIWMALCSGAVLRARWRGNLSAWWDGALAPFWRTGWKGRWHSLIHAGHSWQPPGLCPGFFLGGSGQWAPKGRTKAGECTQIWVTGNQVLGRNQRIKLSNRTDAALLPFPSLKPESPASLQMRPLVLNILRSVWNCSAGTILFLSLVLLLSFHLFYLFPFFFLSSPTSSDFLAQTFLLSLFLSSFSQAHIAPLHLSLKNVSILPFCLPPLLTNSHSVLHFLVVPALDSNTAPNTLLILRHMQSTSMAELEQLITLSESFRWFVSFGVVGVWKRSSFLGSSRCFTSSSDREMD